MLVLLLQPFFFLKFPSRFDALPDFDAGKPPPRRHAMSLFPELGSSLQNTSGPRTPSSPGSRTTFVTSLLRLGVRKFVALIRNHESSLVRATCGKARYLDQIPEQGMSDAPAIERGSINHGAVNDEQRGH
jgi:hypothetical protein